MLAESIVLELCTSGVLDENIQFVKGELKARCDALVEALRERIPEAVFVVPQGGYFLWLDLPRGVDVDALFAAAAARGVQFVKGSDFLLEGGESSLRLAYSGVTPEQIEEGVERLADAYAEIGVPAHAA
jgi:DNA-binding transcriptional MocR family regulator